MDRSDIRGQKEGSSRKILEIGVVQVYIRGQKEGVVQGRDWREVTLEDRRE